MLADKPLQLVATSADLGESAQLREDDSLLVCINGQGDASSLFHLITAELAETKEAENHVMGIPYEPAEKAIP